MNSGWKSAAVFILIGAMFFGLAWFLGGSPQPLPLTEAKMRQIIREECSLVWEMLGPEWKFQAIDGGYTP